MMVTLPIAIALPGLLLLGMILGYVGVPLGLWSAYAAIALFAVQAPLWGWTIFALLALLLNLPPLRRSLLAKPVMRSLIARKILPRISETERAAIAAGTVWIEGEFFSGRPNFERLRREAYPNVELEVRSFLDGAVEKACQMATDWEIHRQKDLPPELWDFLKAEGFFGMVIPREYGGSGFSTLAYSAVMQKLASRSFIHTATVGVANSLGPAKLLLSYGTNAQKERYLPRLASGEEIPCFALTEPMAGSDAAGITARGVIFKDGDGKLYLRLNFRKRYITLGAIATLIGLAFKLSDPENLLGKGKEVGITFALVPAQTPGVILGRRHDPMGVPFYNSPIEGKDVVIPADSIIGGVERAGQGWQMLMQTLAAGRGISFPATCTGVAKFVARVTGAYAVVRQQFGLSIGRFEGIEEPLARIGGLTYLLEAARVYTCGAVDRGERPAVVAAIAKYHFTELTRKMVGDGMDILGGAGICRGPRNLLSHLYSAMPIPITVEGSNILTRTLMIFGQGSIRCHPYLYPEIEAIQRRDAIAFDRLLWQHLGFAIRNGFRAALLSLSRGHLAIAPRLGRPLARYYQKLAWAAATFALLTDLAFLLLGGSLKRREKLAGRFADFLSWLYLGTAALRRFEAEGAQDADLPYFHWAMRYGFAQIQAAIEGILTHLPLPTPIRLPLLAWSRLNPVGSLPDDRLGSRVAREMQIPGTDRDRLTAGIHIPTVQNEALGRLEGAFTLCHRAEAVMQKLKAAQREGKLSKNLQEAIAQARETQLIAEAEAALLDKADFARRDAIQVDAFTLEEYQLL